MKNGAGINCWKAFGQKRSQIVHSIICLKKGYIVKRCKSPLVSLLPLWSFFGQTIELDSICHYRQFEIWSNLIYRHIPSKCQKPSISSFDHLFQFGSNDRMHLISCPQLNFPNLFIWHLSLDQKSFDHLKFDHLPFDQLTLHLKNYLIKIGNIKI